MKDNVTRRNFLATAGAAAVAATATPALAGDASAAPIRIIGVACSPRKGMTTAKAVQAAGQGRQLPAIRATFLLGDGRRMRPTICAVWRREGDLRAEAVDILFSEAELAGDTSFLSPGLAALAITMQFCVRFRYQVLERYLGRNLERKDVMAFNRAMIDLQREATRDPRFAEDRSLIRKKTLSCFAGEDKAAIEKMYERWDEFWRPDGEGKLDKAIIDMDGEALAGIVKELVEMIQQFLTVTSRRFAELIART